jgi:predicted RNA-binding Zn ribbon-like protein
MMVTPVRVAWQREESEMPGSTVRAARPPQISPAPGELEKVRAFVNTRDIEEGTDDLASTAGLADWLARAGLMPVGVPARPGAAVGGARPAPVAPADLVRAVAMRESLRGILRSHVAGPGRHAGGHASDHVSGDAGESAADLRRIAVGLPVRLEVAGDGRITSVPAGSGTDAALAALLLIAAESAALGTWPRLKACGADDCQWAFYDRSPTQNGCWCTMQVCGARAKSRAYRRRAASARPPGGSR